MRLATTNFSHLPLLDVSDSFVNKSVTWRVCEKSRAEWVTPWLSPRLASADPPACSIRLRRAVAAISRHLLDHSTAQATAAFLSQNPRSQSLRRPYELIRTRKRPVRRRQWPSKGRG
jgi:hypothetical protein